MENLLHNISQDFLELVRCSFVSTIFTQKIVNSQWATSEDIPLLTFRQRTSMLTEDECDKEVVRQFTEKYRI